MELNERQIKAVMYTKEKGRIANREYQELCNTSGRTATRDLTDLVSREIFEQVGVTGKGTNYTLKTPKLTERRQKDARQLEDHSDAPSLVMRNSPQIKLAYAKKRVSGHRARLLSPYCHCFFDKTIKECRRV